MFASWCFSRYPALLATRGWPGIFRALQVFAGTSGVAITAMLLLEARSKTRPRWAPAPLKSD